MIIHRKQNFPNPFLSLNGLKSHTVRGFYEVSAMKKCSKCGKEKLMSEFHKDKSYSCGIKARCKKCVNADAKDYADRNPELKKARSCVYYENNKKKINKRASEYRRTAVGRKVKSVSNKKRLDRFPKQARANRLINLEIKNGRVARPNTCSICSKKRKTQAHHCDYSKPLEVAFMCTYCHASWHITNTPLNRR